MYAQFLLVTGQFKQEKLEDVLTLKLHPVLSSSIRLKRPIEVDSGSRCCHNFRGIGVAAITKCAGCDLARKNH
jgi:hypothetical protein